MKISCNQISKKFGKQVILKNFSQELTSEKIYVVTGPNGSGKSTFLKLLSGTDHPDKGKISYSTVEKEIPVSDVAQFISISAPYQELIEELSLQEHIVFHTKMIPSFKYNQAIFEKAKLENHLHKKVGDFSSGMKQRVKLIFACCSEREVLFLDEPTSNLDKDGKEFYKFLLLEQQAKKRLVVIFTNEPDDYSFLSSFELISL